MAPKANREAAIVLLVRASDPSKKGSGSARSSCAKYDYFYFFVFYINTTEFCSPDLKMEKSMKHADRAKPSAAEADDISSSENESVEESKTVVEEDHSDTVAVAKKAPRAKKGGVKIVKEEDAEKPKRKGRGPAKQKPAEIIYH